MFLFRLQRVQQLDRSTIFVSVLIRLQSSWICLKVATNSTNATLLCHNPNLVLINNLLVISYYQMLSTLELITVLFFYTLFYLLIYLSYYQFITNKLLVKKLFIIIACDMTITVCIIVINKSLDIILRFDNDQFAEGEHYCQHPI